MNRLKRPQDVKIDWPHSFAAIFRVNPALALKCMEINNFEYRLRNDTVFIAMSGGVQIIYPDGTLRWISNSRYD